jgi:Flp pilus assembly protein TadG
MHYLLKQLLGNSTVWQRLAPSDCGTVIIEFALILPLFLTCAGAVWEYGRIMNLEITAASAAREGAYYATVNSGDSSLSTDIQNRVMTYLQTSLGSRMETVSGTVCGGSSGDVCIPESNITVQYFDTNNQPASSPGPGYRVEVTVPLVARVYMPFVPGLGQSMTLTGSSSMQLN